MYGVMILRFFLFLISFVFISSISPSYATEQQPENLVNIRLISEKGNIKAGESLDIGIEKVIAPHWHTYWKNPGDSGLPLRITWDLPEGFKMSEIRWPVPMRIPYEPLVNFGYEGRVLLLQTLKAPENIAEGPITIKGDIEVLVCKVECIPEYGSFELVLNADHSVEEDNSAYFDAAREFMPQELGLDVSFYEQDDQFHVLFAGSENVLAGLKDKELELYFEEWGTVINNEPQTVKNENGILVSKKRGERDFSEFGNSLKGVLAFEGDDGRVGYSFKAQHKPVGSLDVSQSGESEGQQAVAKNVKDVTIFTALIFALLGGLILNLMPCVFPVLSLKALSLVKISEKHPEQAIKHGLAYTTGVILSFVSIAGGLMALKAGGATIGWGFQLQNPLIVGGLAYLLFVIGLNLAGFFEFSNKFGNTGQSLAAKQGLSGSFFTGVLATLVATPCTAPFMAGAIGYALVQPAYVGLTVFAALGFGLALPYLALSVFPAFQKLLPKPGAWMDVFKQLLSFPMFGAALWLVWVLGIQTGADGMVSILIGMVLISFAIWMLKHKPKDTFWRNFVFVFVLIAFFGSFLVMPKIIKPNEMTDASHVFGETYNPEKLSAVLSHDDPVFVEMTAAWCITCKINHRVAINVDSTKELFAKENVRFLIGDWTNEDPKITKFLESYGRNGVPLYVFYGARDPATGERPEAVVLPQVLTPSIVKSYILGSQ